MRSFASDYNISETMVYKHLKNLRDNPEYQNHIYKKSGITYFDDTVIHEIEKHLTKTAIAVTDSKTQAELAAANAKIIDLQNAYTDVLKSLNETQGKLLDSQNKILLLSDAANQKTLLQEKLNHSERELENEKQRSQSLQVQLERELQRPLTVRERITGRKKQNNIDGEKND